MLSRNRAGIKARRSIIPENENIYFSRAFSGAFGATGAVQIRSAYSIPNMTAMPKPICLSRRDSVYSVSKNNPTTDTNISSVIVALPILDVFKTLDAAVCMPQL